MKTNNRYMKSEIITNKNGKKQIEGEYIYEEMLFKFHGCEQKGKNPGFRGTISAIDIKGTVLKKRIVNTKDPSKKTKKRISCEFTTPSLGLEESKTEIERVIQRLYSKNSSYIVRELGRKCNPETISIILAAEKYAPQFVSITFPKGNPETQKRTVRKLTRLCAKFSSKAMRDYTEEDVNSIIRINNMSVKDVNLLISFWNYLIVTNHVYGSNPIKKPARMKKSCKSKNTQKIEFLTPKQVEEAFKIIGEKITGVSMGTVLMLGGCFTEKEVMKLTWNDILFKEEEDFACVVRIWDGADATHDRTKPLLPPAAEIIRQRYNILLQTIPMDKLLKCHIVSMITNPKKGCKINALHNFNKDFIIKNFLKREEYKAIAESDLECSASSKVFKNSYCNILEVVCNLEKGSGRYNYLSGKALGSNVTIDSYVCLSDEDGQRYLYSILSCFNRKKDIKAIADKCTADRFTIRTITPESNRSNYMAVIVVKLKRGQSIRINSRYGVTGNIRKLGSNHSN